MKDCKTCQRIREELSLIIAEKQRRDKLTPAELAAIQHTAKPVRTNSFHEWKRERRKEQV